jgi:polysaccharide biosynthesis protein PslH
MNLLYLAHTCPYPPNKGDRIRCFHILAHLAKRHHVTLVYPTVNHDHLNCEKYLRACCDDIFPIKINPWLSYVYCANNLLSKKPLSPAFFYSKRLKRVIEQISPDLILVDCSTMAQYVIDLPHPKILDFVDIDSQKWQLFSSMVSFPRSFLYNLEYTRLTQYEHLLSKRFNFCLVTSDYEKSLLKQTNIVAIRNGIDLESFTATGKSTNNTIIFTGAMNYFPNVDAVVYFHQEIFPLIKQEIPSAKFIIAGMHPTARVKELADEATLVTGLVSDIRPYLSSASVCVVPLRLAKGIQNKILEAMAMEIPVVATSAANRGINATDQQEILVADHPREFAEATVKLLRDHILKERITTRARKFVEQNFCWEQNLSTLDDLILQATGHSMMLKTKIVTSYEEYKL